MVARVIAKQAVDNDLISKIIRNSDSFKLALFCYKHSSKEEWLSRILINMMYEKVGLILNSNGRLKLISGKDKEEIPINNQQTTLLLSKLAMQKAEIRMPEIAALKATSQRAPKASVILPDKRREIFEAIYENNQSVLNSLISNDTDINARDLIGDTPVHCAIRISSDNELIKILIRGGVNLNAINNESYTPFDLAVKLGRIDVANYIENKIILGRISKKGNFSKGIRKAIADGTYSLCQDKYSNCGESYRKAISLSIEEDNQVALCYVLIKAGDYFLHPGKEDYRSASLCYSMARGIAERYFEVNDILNKRFFDHKQEYLETKYLRSIGNNIKPVIRSQEYKQNLKEIRKDCRRSLEQNVDIKSILERNTASMIKLTAKIIEDCMKLLGAPPCEYSIIGLGSMSRGEMALYSDIEYAIIVEDKSYNEYFYQLARLFEIKIVSIGETSPNTEVGKVVGSEVLLDFMRNGYSIDAVNLSPNFGLNTREKASNLINTVEGLISLQHDMDVILPNALRTVCLIYGSKKLLNSYEAAVRNFTLNKSFGKEQAIELLKGDLEQYAPKYNDSNLIDDFDAKNDFYRLPSNLARYLSLYYGLEGKNSWDSLEKLRRGKYISELGYTRIKSVLEFAAGMRIKTHLYYEEEKERVYHQGDEKSTKIKYKLSQQEELELEIKYKVLIAIGEGIKEFVNNRNSRNFKYEERGIERIKERSVLNRILESETSEEINLKRVVSQGREESLFIKGKEDNLVKKLRKAVKCNNITEVGRVVQEGADINCRLMEDGRTALHITSINGNMEIIKFLTENKAQVNIQDIKGRTPLHLAAKYNQVEVVKLLLERGANKEVRDNSDKVAKDYAPSSSHQLKLLLEFQGKERTK